MSCYQEEIFGPVLAVVRVPDLARHGPARTANPYANGVALFTRDSHTAREFVHRVQVGMVGVERAAARAHGLQQLWRLEAQPLFDHHAYGPEGVRFYTGTRR